jgi:hypothetical protein
METSDLAGLRDALLTSKAFLTKMLVREAQLAIAGPQSLADWDDYDLSVAALGSIELQLAQAVALAKDAAPELLDKLKGLSDKSPLVVQSAEIAVNVQIARSRKIAGAPVVLVRKTAAAVSFFMGSGLVKKLLSKKKEELPLCQMLVDIERLLPLVDALMAAVDRRRIHPDSAASA